MFFLASVSVSVSVLVSLLFFLHIVNTFVSDSAFASVSLIHSFTFFSQFALSLSVILSIFFSFFTVFFLSVGQSKYLGRLQNELSRREGKLIQRVHKLEVTFQTGW